MEPGTSGMRPRPPKSEGSDVTSVEAGAARRGIIAEAVKYVGCNAVEATVAGGARAHRGGIVASGRGRELQRSRSGGSFRQRSGAWGLGVSVRAEPSGEGPMLAVGGL